MGQSIQTLETVVGDRRRLAVVALRGQNQNPDVITKFQDEGWDFIQAHLDVISTSPVDGVTLPDGGDLFVKKEPGPFIFCIFDRPV